MLIQFKATRVLPLQNIYFMLPWIEKPEPVIKGLFALHSWSNQIIPGSNIHGANMGPTWVCQDPGRPHVGHINLGIWDDIEAKT